MEKEIKEIQLDEKAIGQIAEQVQLNTKELVDKKVNTELEKFYSQQEEAKKKTLQKAKDDFLSLDTNVKNNKFLRAMAKGNMAEIARMKDYLRTGSTENDTGSNYLIPPADFSKTIFDLELEYGVAKKYADVRTVSSNSMTIPVYDTRITVASTAEAGAKPISTPVWSQKTVTLGKYTAIVPMTEEMIEDSAFDIFSMVSQQFATEFARIEDTLVFTDGTSGIINQVGINVVRTSTTTISSITYNNLNEMIYGVPPKSMNGGRFFMNRAILGVIQRITTDDGFYIWQPNVNGAVAGTIWGYPVELVEVMSSTLTESANTAYAIFGNLKYVVMIEKGGMKLKVLEEGTLIEDEETEYNLAQDDMVALRGVKRMSAVCVMPAAFSVLKTAIATS